MITKVYGIRSLSYFSTTLKIIPALNCKPVRKRIEFTPVSLCGVGSSYTTNDMQEQLAIESLGAFKRGEIIITATFGDKVEEVTTTKVAEKKVVAEETPTECDCDREIKEYVRVSSVQGAANVLVRDYGADPDEVDDIDKVLAYAKKVGASFPKLQ